MRFQDTLFICSVFTIHVSSVSTGYGGKKHDTTAQYGYPFRYRDGNKNCPSQCIDKKGPLDNSSDLQVFYNGNAALIGVTNNSANIAFIVDFNDTLAALLNGRTGLAILIDANTKTIYHIADNGTWSALKCSFESYFQNLTSLAPLAKLGKLDKDSCSFNNINSKLLKEIDIQLVSLDIPFSKESLNFTGKYSGQLRSVLSFLYKGNGFFTIRKSFMRFIYLNLAFAEILANVEGELQSMNISFNLEDIFRSSSGVEGLIRFLSQIGTQVDLSKLLRSYLASPEMSLRLIAFVSRGSNDGIDGLIIVLLNIINANNGNGSFIEVINILLSYEPILDGSSDDMTHIIKEALDLIHTQNRLFNNSAAFDGIVRILQALINQNLVLNRIQISDIIKALRFQSPREVIHSIISIIIQYIISAPNFTRYVHYFIDFLNSTNQLGNRLRPGVELSNLIFQFDNLSQSVLNNISRVMQIISHNSNISYVLLRFPRINQSISEISSSLNNQFNISRYLNITSILGEIQHPFEGPLMGFEQLITPFRDAALAIGSNISNALGLSTGSDSDTGLGYLDGAQPIQILFKKGNSHKKHNIHEKKENKFHPKRQGKSEHNKLHQ